MFLFFDDQIANIYDVQTAFPSSTCVLIDPNPVERDIREFEGNPYAQLEMPDMNIGFNEEHMAMTDAWLSTVENPILVFDWDKTVSVVEGIRMPPCNEWQTKSGTRWLQNTFEDTGMRLEDVCHVILGGHARIALLKSFFERVKANIIVLTNNPSACPLSQVAHVFGDDPTCYNRPEFLRLIRFIIPTFQERNLIASHMYDGIKSVALKDYFENGFTIKNIPYYIRVKDGKPLLIGGTKKRRIKYGSRRNKELLKENKYITQKSYSKGYVFLDLDELKKTLNKD